MKHRELLIWIVILVVVGIGGIVWVMSSRPSTAEVEAAVRPLDPLPQPSAVLNDELFGVLDQRVQHGTLPVEPVPASPPRDNPF